MENNHISVWGRTLEEYRKIFSLYKLTPQTKIISIADGPSTFNLQLREIGLQAISVDPIYNLSVDNLKACFEESYLFNKNFFYQYPDKFNLTSSEEVETLLSKRRKTFENFINDYIQNRNNYQFGKLPALNFNSKSFDLCLCSNFLFLFEHLFDFDFHLNSIKELLRIGSEVRIFPLYNNNGQLSNYVSEITEYLSENNFKWTIESNDYHIYKYGNRFLKISS